MIALSETADQTEIVIGVDTHKDCHVAVALSPLGVVLDSRTFPVTAAGYQELLDWSRNLGRVTRVGVEGTGSYGVGLTRALRAAGVLVIEVNRPNRAMRRRRGKSDAVDAEAAARAVLSGEATAAPKSGDGPIEAIRVLKIAKDSAVKARVQAVNQLKAVLVNAPARVREPWTVWPCRSFSPGAPRRLRMASELPSRPSSTPWADWHGASSTSTRKSRTLWSR